MNPNKLRRTAAAALVLALTLPQAAFAAAPTIETDEAVYINLDYYGHNGQKTNAGIGVTLSQTPPLSQPADPGWADAGGTHARTGHT